MTLTALETMQIFARCIIRTLLDPGQKESQVAVTWRGTVTKGLLLAFIFPPLRGPRFVCWGLGTASNNETEDDRKEFLVYCFWLICCSGQNFFFFLI